MKYLVLRNCFTAECVYYKKGEVVNLPDAMDKNEKNFRLMEKSMTEPPPEPTPAPAPEPKPVLEPSPEAPKPPTSPVKEAESTIPPDEGKGFGNYLCPKCKVTHKVGSKVHKRHLKLLKSK